MKRIKDFFNEQIKNGSLIRLESYLFDKSKNVDKTTIPINSTKSDSVKNI